ncbi:MAG: diaminopimelate decarboxylase [Rectinemataceae bacterium]|jgi:diaminopimelate decarboxylase
MTEKRFPLSRERLEAVCREHPTPFHLYDERAIRDNAKNLTESFSILGDGFKEFFAVKALPNPFIIKILAAEGFGADASSLPEIVLAQKAGLGGEAIMFSSNDTPSAEFAAAVRAGVIVNLDDVSHIDSLAAAAGIPEIMCCRYNPGPLKKGNAIIGKPEEAKYGFTREQLFEGYRRLKAMGAKRFGLHTMVASNELDPDYFVETGRILFELVVEISKALGIRFEFVNIGGGIGIPYRPEQTAVPLRRVARGLKAAYDEIIVPAGLAPLKIVMECGRVITGPYGWLVSRVIHLKNTYRKYLGLDASMANLMRPGMYGAYHHVTVMGKENADPTETYDVTGSLCENNDKFAVARALPPVEVGDLVVLHDTGAHGHAMGFNYNGKLRSAELLLREDGKIIEIRRAETMDDYFRTLDFARLDAFDAGERHE